MNYLGKDRQFVRSNVPHPIGLSVLLGSIYWMDSSQGAVYRADKDDPERPAKVLKGGLQKLMAIAIFDKALQPNGKIEQM
jgi:low density lipoprotein-related protein 2